MKEKLEIIESLLVLVDNEIKKGNKSYSLLKGRLEDVLKNNNLLLNDINNPLQNILSSFLYLTLNDCLNDKSNLRELVGMLDKFTKGILTVDSNKITEEERIIGYDLSGKPIVEKVTVKATGNIALKDRGKINTALKTTGVASYDTYLDELDKWSRDNNLVIGKNTNLSTFCHILDLFQKTLKLTQPDENATNIYKNFIKRFFNRV